MKILFLILLSVPWVRAYCPNSAFIEPCTCRKTLMGMHIMCSAVNSAQTLSLPLRYLNSYEVTTLLLNRCHFTSPVNLYALQVTSIKVIDSTYNSSGNASALQGADRHVRVMEFRRSNIELGSGNLGILTQLRELKFHRCNVRKFPKNLVQGSTELETVIVEDSTVGEVLPGALAGATRLKYVKWTDSELKSLSRDVFPRPSDDLLVLDFRNNQLESLPEDMFTGMPNLKTVLLDGNSLSRLPSNVWLSIWDQLTTIGLENNRITCDRDILWMFEGTKHEKAEGQCAGPSLLVNAKIKAIQKRDIESANPLL